MNCKQKKEECVNKNYVFKGRILNLRSDDALSATGRPVKREIVEHNGGSSILCEKEGKVLLVKQFRYAVDKFLWEIPAGKAEMGEDPKITAIRELEEECGILATDMTLLYEVYPSPGYTTEVIRIYRAENLSVGVKHFDEDEDIVSEWFTKEQIKEMIKNGEITDGKTLIAVLSVL